MKYFFTSMAAKLLLLSAILFSVAACSNDNFEEIHPELYCDTTGTITYEKDIKAILELSCGSTDVNCHKTGNVQEVNLDNYDETKDAADNGDLLGSILHEPGFEPMPDDGGKLDVCSIMAIRAWINRGVPEN